MKIALACVALLALAILWFACVGTRFATPGTVPVVGSERAPGDRAELAELNAAGSAAPSRVSIGSTPTPAPPPSLTEVALLEQLRRVARAEREIRRAGVGTPVLVQAFEDALSPFLFSPPEVDRVLELLRRGVLTPALAPDADPASAPSSEEEYGAVVVLYSALIGYSSPSGELVEAGVTGDPVALLLAILRAFPSLREPVRGALAIHLIGARLEGKFVLDMRCLEEILRLRSRFPELKEFFSSLLQNIGAGLSAEQRRAFYALLLEDEQDATMLGVALQNLLQADESGIALQIAHELLSDPELGDESRDAILRAVALSASELDAGAFLVEHDTRDSMHTLLSALGRRDAGQVALDTQYSLLVEQGANPKLRQSLVYGMWNGDVSRLQEIARTDSDLAVRGQALCTLTAHRGAEALNDETFAVIENYLASGGGEADVRAMWAAGAAGNAAFRARKLGETKWEQRAVALMLDVARDESLTQARRERTAQLLKPHLSPGDYEALLDAIHRGQR